MKCSAFLLSLTTTILATLSTSSAALGQSTGITVNAQTVVKLRGTMIGGTNTSNHSYSTNFVNGENGINFQADAAVAKLPLIRVGTYPDDRSTGSITFCDQRIQAVINSGAQPLLQAYIGATPADNAPQGASAGPYYNTDGTTVNGTVATNVVYMVQRYTAAPYNLTKIYYEIGNEPNISIDGFVTPQAYSQIFNSVDAALTAAGIRNKVFLMGPVLSGGSYPNGNYADVLMAHSGYALDIMDYHDYSNSDDNGLLNAPHKFDLLFDFARPIVLNTGQNFSDYAESDYGDAALLYRMDRAVLPKNVTVAITEHNGTVSTVPAAQGQSHGIGSGLYNLGITHFLLYNPRGQADTSFVFDQVCTDTGYAHYDCNNQRDYSWYALYIRNNFTGPYVLSQSTTGNLNPSGFPSLLVSATRDDSYLYLEVINRNVTTALSVPVTLNGTTVTGPATIYQMSNGQFPNVPINTSYTVTSPFTYSFPAESATIFKIPIHVSSDFVLTAGAPTQVAVPGSSITYAVTSTPSAGFVSPVTLSVTGLPTGATASFSPTSFSTGSGTSTLTVTTTASVAAGLYPLTVTGTGPSTHTFNVNLRVSPATFDFISNTTVSIGNGATLNSPITVVPEGGFSQMVNLAVTGLPAGVTVNPLSLDAGGESNVVFNAATSAPPGTYNINFVATSADGTITHTVPATLTVFADFALSASPSSAIGNAGYSSAYTLTVAPRGSFTGTVAFSTTSVPPGITSVTFSPTSVTGGAGTSTATVNTSTSIAPGAYNVGINGTSGTLKHSTTLTVDVCGSDFTAAAPVPNSQTRPAGGNTSYDVVIAGTNTCFLGNISFSVAGLPTGVTPTYSPTVLAGSGVETITLNIDPSTAAGTYNFTINATGPSTAHPTTATLVVVGAISVGSIGVDANTVFRNLQTGIGGTNILSHSTTNFQTNTAPDQNGNVVSVPFQANATSAKLPFIRTGTYPDDRTTSPLSFFDTKVQAILNSGAQPLLTSLIGNTNDNHPSGGTTGLYYNLDGTTGGSATVATNAVYLVKHYTGMDGSGFHMPKVYLEVGNEPDLTIDHQVASAAEYVATFNSVHNALVAAGIRDKVALMGPVVSYGYYEPWFYDDNNPAYLLRHQIIDAFLAQCNSNVDFIVYHSYSNEQATDATVSYDLLNEPKHLDDQQNPVRTVNPGENTLATDPNSNTAYRGLAALLAQMSQYTFARPNLGIAVTEHNTSGNIHTIGQGLWQAALTHYHLYTPEDGITTSFVYDALCNSQGYAHYDCNNNPDYAYWAMYLRNNYTAPQILNPTVSGNLNEFGNPYLLVTATRDSANLHLEVINRATWDITDQVSVNGATASGTATVASMANGVYPNATSTTPLTAPFNYTFPAQSATVIVLPIGKSLAIGFETAQGYTAGTTLVGQPSTSSSKWTSDVPNGTPPLVSVVASTGNPGAAAQATSTYNSNYATHHISYTVAPSDIGLTSDTVSEFRTQFDLRADYPAATGTASSIWLIRPVRDLNGTNVGVPTNLNLQTDGTLSYNDGSSTKVAVDGSGVPFVFQQGHFYTVTVDMNFTAKTYTLTVNNIVQQNVAKTSTNLGFYQTAADEYGFFSYQPATSTNYHGMTIDNLQFSGKP